VAGRVGRQVGGAEGEAVDDVDAFAVAPDALELLAAGDVAVGELPAGRHGHRVAVGDLGPGHLERAAQLRLR